MYCAKEMQLNNTNAISPSETATARLDQNTNRGARSPKALLPFLRHSNRTNPKLFGIKVYCIGPEEFCDFEILVTLSSPQQALL